MSFDNVFSQQLFELSLSNEDFEDFHRERSILHSKVTTEEIQKLSIDEDLDLFGKTKHILKNGQEVQLMYLFENLHKALIGLSALKKLEILSLVKDVLVFNPPKDVNIACGKCIERLLDVGIIDRSLYVASCFEFTIRSLKTKDKEINEVWLSTAVAAIRYLNDDDKDELLNFLDDSVSLSRCTITRKSCCQIISHLTPYLPQDKVETCLMPKMKALCQDIDLDIRSTMCSELELMVDHSSTTAIEESIIPELMLLFQDEERTVREVGFASLINIVPKLSPGFIENSNIVESVLNFYRRTLLKKQSFNMVIAAKYIGKFLFYLKAYLSNENVEFFLEKFQALCSYGSMEATSSFNIDDNFLSFSGTSLQSSRGSSSIYESTAECRYWCAYNLPAMVQMLPRGTFKDHLHSCFVVLVKDNQANVRKAVAASLHVVAGMLGEDVHFIFNSLKILLKDADIEVVDNVLTHLADILIFFLHDKVSKILVPDLVPVMLQCEQELSKSLRWRIHEKLLSSMACLHQHLPSDHIYYRLVPVIYSILTGESKVLPVRLAAARTYLTFIKYNTSVEERTEMCKRLVTEFAQSPCSRSRIFFIQICYDVADLFSKSFFKENVYDTLMTFAADPMVNVRIKFCQILPLMKLQLKLPCDRLLLQLLEQTVRRIMALESSGEVSSTIRNVISELDSVRLTMDGIDEEEEDREKEDLEEKITELFHQQNRQEEHGRSMSLAERATAEKINPHHLHHTKGGRNRKSGSFSGALSASARETSKKLSSKSSLTSSNISPRKIGSTTTSKSNHSSFGSGARLSSKKSSTHSTSTKRPK